MTGTCASCGSLRVGESLQPDHFVYGDHKITISGFHVPVFQCEECGMAYTDWRAEGLRHHAVCDFLNVLRPNDIRAVRDNLTRAEFSAIIGTTEEIITHLETGRLIVSKDLNEAILAYGKEETSLYYRRC